MGETPRLEMAGLGPFIDYGEVARRLRSSGRLVVSLDEDARELLEEWCRRVGASMREVSRGLYLVEVGGQPPAASSPPAAPAAAEAAPTPPTRWRPELSRRLADPAQLLSLILRSKPLYRGAAGQALEDLLRGDKLLLVKASLGGRDYVVLVEAGEVVAGAEPNRPLERDEAKRVLSSVIAGSASSVAVYDASQAGL